MKKLYLFFAMVMGFAVSNGQGTNCNNAVTVISKPICIYQSYQTPANSNVMWFSFIAESTNVNISVVTTKFGINAPHIHQLALGGGICSNIVVIAEDELPFEDDADKLSIDLNASGLIVGQTYFIRVKRQATDTCDKASCRANNSSDPTAFNLCIENVNVIIPLDFGIEKPAISHAYHQNRGQLIDANGNPRPDIKLYTNSANPAVYLSDTSVSYVFTKIYDDSISPDTFHRVDMTLEGANTNTRVFKTEQIPGVINYYLAHVPKGITRNKGFSRAVTNDVYPNIDMQFYSNSEGVKYYFVVRPGGNADDIIMKFDGATSVNVTTDSSKLEIITSIGTLDFEAGHAYQINPGNQIIPMPWQAKFIKTSTNKVKLDIRNYPHNMPLYIQIDRGHVAPSNAVTSPEWCTFFGGTERDFAHDIIVDDEGNIYIVGETNSLPSGLNPFPIAGQSIFQPTPGGGYDAFVAMFNAQYERIWATYFGGNNDDFGYSIAHSNTGTGKVYFTGVSSSISSTLPTFPLSGSSNSFIQNRSSENVFITRLSDDFGVREWHTFFGGAYGRAYKIKADNSGNIYVVGRMGFPYPISSCVSPPSDRFPICDPGGGAYVQFTPGGGDFFYFDGFIAKFNSSTELVWSTLLGGLGDWDVINSIAIDENNNLIYVVGSTNSKLIYPSPSCGTPPTNGSFPLCDGVGGYYQDKVNADNDFSPFTGGDAFIARFSTSGVMDWSSFFGGFGDDYGTDIGVNSIGQVYITGWTNTYNYTTQVCAPPIDGTSSDEAFPNCESSITDYKQFFANGGGATGSNEYFDAFIAKFEFPQPHLLWTTFIGGNRAEKSELINSVITVGPRLAIDSDDNIHLTGNTRSGSYVGDTKIPLSNNSNYYYQDINADENYNSNNSVIDGFITSFNPDNQLILGTLFGGKDNDMSEGIFAYLDKIYLTGGSNSTSVFPLSNPTNLPNPYFQGYSTVTSSKSDAFIAQIRKPFPVSSEKIEKQKVSFIVFPNPSGDGYFNIEAPYFLPSKAKITIYNSIGEQILITKNSRQLDLSHFPNGIYFINMVVENKTYSSKIIIQK